MNYIVLIILLFAVELVYFRIAKHFNIIDKPNERSSHSRITLRGGGVVFYIGVLFYFISEGFQYTWFFLGLSIISFISFIDDIQPRSNNLKLLIHFVALGFMFFEWNMLSLPWYYSFISLVLCAGILNAYNFMDGINGITGAYSLVVVLSLWYINSYQFYYIDNKLIYALLSALLVFNFFNFRTNAKCFAGDVGSISVAFIIVFLLGMLIVKSDDLSYIVLLVVYGVDSVLTIIHRLLLKENIFIPHRIHVFQIMANELKLPHLLVSVVYAIMQLIIIIGFFIFKSDSYIYLYLTILILSFFYIYFKFKYYRSNK